MNEFLGKLEKKISILEESEREKITKKYQKEIEKKIKEGIDEKEAIESLGSFDEIIKNIYLEYHINYEYKEENKSFGKMLDNGINKCAKFLTEFCQELIDYAKKNTSDKPLEAIFELILKILLLIMAFMFLKLPFILLEEIFIWLFDLLFYPFNVVLIAIVHFILAIVYLGCCIMLGISMFKNFQDQKPKEDKSQEKDDKSEGKTIIKEEKKEDKNKAFNYTFIVLKVFLYVIVIIPMILLNIAFFVLALFAGFLVFKGVNIIGLAIVLIGIFLLTTVLTNYITDALDNKYKNHLFSLCISVIAIIIGGILFTDNLVDFNYPKDLSESKFIITNETTIIDIKKETEITGLDGDIIYEIDNSLADNQILLEISYYDEFTDVHIENYEGKENDYILIYTLNDNTTMKSAVYFYQNALEDLKVDNIYDYRDLKKIKITIYCNEITKELLK